MGGLLIVGGCEGYGAGTTGAVAGAGVGALAGQAIGGDTESTLTGAALGGLAGHVIGDEMDRKKTQQQVGAAQQAAGAAQQAADTVIINVVNSNGSIFPVALRRQGNIYIGPRGEQYTSLPTAEQLKPIYGF